MSKDITIKNWWDILKCKYHVKQITKTREKNIATNETSFWRKMSLKFQTLASNFMKNAILYTEKVPE